MTIVIYCGIISLATIEKDIPSGLWSTQQLVVKLTTAVVS